MLIEGPNKGPGTLHSQRNSAECPQTRVNWLGELPGLVQYSTSRMKTELLLLNLITHDYVMDPPLQTPE